MCDEKTDENYLKNCREALDEEQTKSLAETNNWEHVDKNLVHKDWDILYKEIALNIDTSKPQDDNIQKYIKRHFDIACRFYIPTKKAYIGMSIFYSENSDMKDFHNTYHPKMVEFLGDAICLYAEGNL